MITLSEGVSRSMTQPLKADAPTDPPSRRMTPVPTRPPTHPPNPSPTYPPTNRPTTPQPSLFNPTNAPIDKSVSRTSPPTMNARDAGEAPFDIATDAGSSTTPSADFDMTTENGQLPLLSDRSFSPTMT